MLVRGGRSGVRLRINLRATATSAARPAKKKAARRPPKAEVIRERIEDAWLRVVNDDWRNGTADPAALMVGHWAQMHAALYKVDVVKDLASGKEWMLAIQAARRVIERFGAERAIDYCKWAWLRERTAEMRRAHNPPGAPRFRLGWRRLFCSHDMLLDYEVEERR